MNIRQTIAISAVAAAVAIAGAESAQAQALQIGQTVTVTNVGVTGTDPITISDPSAGPNHGPVAAYATAILFTINGKQVLVNCDDLWHDVNAGEASDTYTVAAFSGLNSAPNAGYPGINYDQAQINAMSWLVTESDQIWSNTNQQAAANAFDASLGITPVSLGLSSLPTFSQDLGALQFASWEIGNESGAPNPPDAVFSGESATIQKLASDYVNYFDLNDPTLPNGFVVYQLVSPNGVQDQIFAEAVPEPATWTMFLIGFGGIGFMLRGSRRKNAVAAG